ncbi:UDP-glycosyltransferase UGT5-like isoform X2 [Eriocheir sinensis]|nr:UDP-glycosyltransferase UGT5-like isoform X2 [Eriocheir sinensis]XP_050729348.1 UDP-glycosyltransferase UGT5-like isoform X2 [Eriocheir sinensis]XP_050729355.1 UDP-glycosyltransferase UGT5-like isoform X2 [Eriocheir sinensis]XP_050729366.1 UDP-glycosyltransferase UGT5-like isoform X2 [Eriocheir sinensis]
MKVMALCILAAALMRGAAGDLTPPERSYKILMLLTSSSKSHKNVFMPFAEALADRGHKVVMLSGFQQSSENQNILEINHGVSAFSEATASMFSLRNDGVGSLSLFENYLPTLARELYKVPKVKQLYGKRKDFDLIVVDSLFNELVYPFLHEVPFITVAACGVDPRQSAILGNVLNPSYVPNLVETTPFPMSVWQRLKNTAMTIYFAFYWRNWKIVPQIQKEISAQFPDLPPLLEIERNQSLTLLNTHFTITNAVPLLPSQVEVGAMHCRPAKPLPEDLESWIIGAGDAGAVYFSLGSVAAGESMPPKYRQAFLEAFRRLPQRILWKYEGEMEGVPDNVRLSKWLPQQDILAHNNVKVFMSHGGQLSLTESIFHATPLLVLPIFGNQLRNAKFMEISGSGRILGWEELTADRIVDALIDLINNPKYKESVSSTSSVLRDQLTTPQERAVYWTEYVIRHRGAPQLRCQAAQLSWVEFLLLDVVGLLLLTLLVLLLLLRRLLRAVSAAVFRGHVKEKSE